MNIAIIGSYGSSNIGDEAILEVIMHNLKPDDQKYIFSGAPIVTNRNLEKLASNFKNYIVCPHLPFGIRSFFKFTWLKSLKYLIKSDLVLVGGGGLFTDIYTIKAVFLWSFHIFIAYLLQKKIILLANSVGPLKSHLAQNVTKWSINKCSQIIVRDSISKKLVQTLLPKKKVLLASDPVFLYLNYHKIKARENILIDDKIVQQVKNYQSSSSLKLETKNKATKLLALSLRDWQYDAQIFIDFIDYVLQQNFKVLLIPMEIADEIILRPWQKNGVSLVYPQNLAELAEILSQCEIAIGMRLHFLIMASLMNCKVGGIAYSSKVNGILQAIEIPYLTMEQLNLVQLKNLLAISCTAKNLTQQQKLAQNCFRSF